MMGENREYVSTTVSTLIFLPVASWSWTKSIAHVSFGGVDAMDLENMLCEINPDQIASCEKSSPNPFYSSVDEFEAGERSLMS